ncbi:hypothetical protein P2E27_11095 [Mannheimia haemolytica]|nr:hypothetical protein [Mannheimia haemolytica]
MNEEKYFSVDVSDETHVIRLHETLEQAKQSCLNGATEAYEFAGDMDDHESYESYEAYDLPYAVYGVVLGRAKSDIRPHPLATTSRTTKGGKMTDTERLDFIAQRKLDVRYSDLVDEFIIASYTKPHEQYFHWARNADLRTAIDEAMKEMRGLNNATTN